LAVAIRTPHLMAIGDAPDQLAAKTDPGRTGVGAIVDNLRG
jgi:hypothetical protein